MIDSVPLIQNANDAQQINASIIAMKKASRELDEKIVKLNSLNSELDKKIALLDSGLNKEIEDRKEAIKSLDVSSVGGSGKYISAISETDGKISATASDITSTVSSGNSQPVTSGGVAEALHRPLVYNDILNDFNGAWYFGKENYEGIFFIQGNSAHEPIASAYSWFVKTLHKKYSTNKYVITQIAINTDPYMIYTRTALSTDNETWTWQSWKKIITDNDLVNSVTSNNMNPVTSNAVAWEITKFNGLGAISFVLSPHSTKEFYLPRQNTPYTYSLLGYSDDFGFFSFARGVTGSPYTVNVIQINVEFASSDTIKVTATNNGNNNTFVQLFVSVQI